MEFLVIGNFVRVPTFWVLLKFIFKETFYEGSHIRFVRIDVFYFV
ncbi:hypothetical protein LEP1GSC172_1145 [Leptospira noguchii]|uniref:Uncharacterized protein n=2 Tax=Leptospira noguchii TaxID=28182 RepID=T0GM46_9LEPT|nr:hypothetical protein LEP1GSC172_1145 [Leptospira noguchii]EQA69967.1 hypothetical protein LEP1GSC059_2031 [Leptospira noguchii serovar Panama str. CZ214]